MAKHRVSFYKPTSTTRTHLDVSAHHFSPGVPATNLPNTHFWPRLLPASKHPKLRAKTMLTPKRYQQMDTSSRFRVVLSVQSTEVPPLLVGIVANCTISCGSLYRRILRMIPRAPSHARRNLGASKHSSSGGTVDATVSRYGEEKHLRSTSGRRWNSDV